MRAFARKILNGARLAGRAVPDVARVGSAVGRLDLALLDPLFPAWAKGFHAEYEYGEITRRLAARCAVFGMENDLASYYSAIAGARKENPYLASVCFPAVLAPAVLGFKSAYSCFPRAIHNFLPKIVAARANFSFTAYPGAFLIDNPVSDRRLLELTGARGFTKVLTTQPLARQYLTGKLGLDPDAVDFVFGGVCRLPEGRRPEGILIGRKVRVVFCAHRHMPGGLDKGLDVFFEIAKLLLKASRKFEFVLVGPFESEVADVRPALGSSLVWHPYLHNSELVDLYSRCDVFFSFLRPNLVEPGRFDGFPVAAAVQAAAAGALVLINDPLGQGTNFFEKDRHYLESSADAKQMCELLMEVAADPSWARRIAGAGCDRVREIYELDYQLEPRLRMIAECLRV